MALESTLGPLEVAVLETCWRSRRRPPIASAQRAWPGFWGLTKNQIKRLDTSAPSWFVVLLLRSNSAGYVLTSAQVAKRIADGSFELSGDGDFKVNEGLDLQPAEAFGSIEELLGRIL